MAEEKKEEVKKQEVETEQKAQPQAEQPQPAPANAEAKPKEKKEEAPIEKPANCIVCNKSIKKKKWYYRNGKYYCSKRCWQKTLKKDSPAEDNVAPAA